MQSTGGLSWGGTPGFGWPELFSMGFALLFEGARRSVLLYVSTPRRENDAKTAKRARPPRPYTAAHYSLYYSE